MINTNKNLILRTKFPLWKLATRTQYFTSLFQQVQWKLALQLQLLPPCQLNTEEHSNLIDILNGARIVHQAVDRQQQQGPTIGIIVREHLGTLCTVHLTLHSFSLKLCSATIYLST